MVSFRKIRYLVLAGLVLSLPAKPMGLFDTPWKKLGVGVAAVAALAGLVYGINYYRKKTYEREEFIAGREAAVLALDSHKSLESMIKEHRDFYDKKRLNGLLLNAAENGADRIVEVLLTKYGADVNAQVRDSYFSPCDWKRRSEMNVIDQRTPIYLALIYSKNFTTVKLLLDHGACIAHQPIDHGREYDVYHCINNMPGCRDELVELFDEYRRKKYNDNANVLSREIFNTVTSFSTPIIKITAAYAAEYPLMVGRSLAFKQEQEEAVHIQEVPMIEAPVRQSHSLSLDVQAI